MFAVAAETAIAAPHGPWLAEHAWIIVALPIVSFVLTLFFGKRFRGKGQEIGLGLIGLSLLLSVVLGAQWLGRDTVALHEGSPVAISAAARGFEVALPAAEHPGASESPEQASPETEHAATNVRPYVEREWKWYSAGNVDINVGFRIDGFAIVMLFTVAFISFLVHLYSTSYMEGDARKTHYFASLGLFTAGMYILVTASSGLLMLVGWEIMGLCSFLLIGHWWEKKENTDAALKAFLTTRTGDIGLLVGLSIMFFACGQTFNLGRWNQLAAANQIPQTLLVCGAVALFIACIGKSAQFPLHTWLPDAMAGPTPASSLIHAATMVVAGVYMVARLFPVFFQAFNIIDARVNVIACIGGITIIIAAGLAFVQQDIKKVMAYSTVSQLGYMVMGLGVGSWTGAIFHLFTHAFFKCLLFQACGAISHSCYHSFDMRDYGGLKKLLPKTHATFAIGALALIGVFPFAGFFSKDEILLGAHAGGYEAFFWVGTIGAFMTAAYVTRAYVKTFLGEHHGPQTEDALQHAVHGHGDDHAVVEADATHIGRDEHAGAGGHGAVGHDAHVNDWGLHESPMPMMVPLYVLAAMSVIAGIINFPTHSVEGFTKFTAIEPIVAAGVAEHPFSWFVALTSSAFGFAGIGISYAYNTGRLPFLEGLTERVAPARWLYTFLENKYYLDKLYENVFIYAIKKPIAGGAYWFNQHVIDGVVNGVGTSAKVTADFVYRNIDQGVVDGAVNGSGRGANGLGRAFALVSSGKVQQYAAILLGGAAFGAILLAFVN